MANDNTKLTLAAIKERLATARGKQYWRALEELAETPEFREALENEIPDATRYLDLHMDRRQFLTLSAASLALAGLSGCRYLPQHKLVPYVNQPEEETPGVPLYYASTAPTFWGYGIGTIVTSRDGRPIKMDGNPGHPASLGSTDIFTQAATLTLYDPDRSQAVSHEGDFSTWEEFFNSARSLLQRQLAVKGAGLRILTETVTSPTLAAQLQAILKRYPQAQWVQYEPTYPNNRYEADLAAYGEPVGVYYDLAKAKRILSLDSDFLISTPGSVRYARDFADGRRVRKGTTEITRFYSVESTPTLTGAMADNRIRVRASQVEGIARVIAQRLGVDVGTAPVPSLDEEQTKFVNAVVKDLQENSGACVVIPGDYQTPVVHVLAHMLNEHLGNVGKTVFYTEPIEAQPVNQLQAFKNLVADMNAGKVDMLLMLGGNPVYNAPADSGFSDALSRVPFRAHLGLYVDETSLACQWHLPESHFLEAWGDLRAFDGTASIVQPLIIPIYDTKSAYEVLSGLFDIPETGAVGGTEPRDGYTIVRQYWAEHGYPIQEPYDFAFNKLLHDGVIPNTKAKAKNVQVRVSALASLPVQNPANVGGTTVEVMIRPDPTVWDGRYANNGWLQELPKPFSKATWDNVAFMNPETAEKLNIPLDNAFSILPKLSESQGVKPSPVIELSINGQTIKAAVWMLPGHPHDAVTLFLGYGRTSAGTLGSGTGFNVYPLFFSNSPWNSTATIAYKGESYRVANTQFTFLMDGRDVVRVGTIAEFLRHPSLAPSEEAEQANAAEGTAKGQPDYYPSYQWPEPGMSHQGAYNWGMVIDLQSCIGCSVCMVACQAENNIPVVGKTQVLRGRHMNWIRVDTYYETKPDDFTTFTHNPRIYFQPVTCMQCEQAPCEYVCPVGATQHSVEGINQMVYNRCIGTRYCANNCPYKVRRFNFLNYNNHFNHDYFGRPNKVEQLVFNPNVTVRGRGVMEKCMYCIQRINSARQKAKIENRNLRDGEVVTACQQACPTQAIVFGNITDYASKVHALKIQPHNYGLLTDLNTRPRTTYLARVINPNPEIEPETEKQSG